MGQLRVLLNSIIIKNPSLKGFFRVSSGGEGSHVYKVKKFRSDFY